MCASDNVSNLVEEYKALLESVAIVSIGPGGHDPDKVENLLVADGAWTPSAAEHLLRLSKDYGSFMLRNALALSLALGIEDGELGF